MREGGEDGRENDMVSVERTILSYVLNCRVDSQFRNMEVTKVSYP